MALWFICQQMFIFFVHNSEHIDLFSESVPKFAINALLRPNKMCLHACLAPVLLIKDENVYDFPIFA